MFVSASIEFISKSSNLVEAKEAQITTFQYSCLSMYFNGYLRKPIVNIQYNLQNDIIGVSLLFSNPKHLPLK